MTKIRKLKKIYALYDTVIADMACACKMKCASCCTCNVTMTSLEAEFILAALSNEEKRIYFNKIKQHFPQKRYIPRMTTNMFARRCMQGSHIPDEENDPSWGTCPLLVDDLCCLYDIRPFGCRALISDTHCSQNGYARVSPIVLTIHNVFMQTIEHLDQQGFSGNLSDMLILFLSDDPTQTDQILNPINKDNCFVPNEKVPMLMVPPEHQKKLNHLIKDLLDVVNNED